MRITSVAQKTLFIIKPDAMRRELKAPILKEVEASGLKIVKVKEGPLPLETLNKLYDEHRGRDYFPKLLNFMGSGPVVCAVLEGENAISDLRALMGSTYPSKADLKSIRGKYKGPSDIGPSGAVENLVHGSDREERAAYEIGLIFGS